MKASAVDCIKMSSQGFAVSADGHVAGHLGMADLHSSQIRLEAQILLTNDFNDGTLCACVSNRFLALANFHLGHVRLLVCKFRAVTQLFAGYHRANPLGRILTASHR